MRPQLPDKSDCRFIPGDPRLSDPKFQHKCRLKVTKRKVEILLNTEEQMKIIAMRRKGMTADEIAEVIGRHPGYVRSAILTILKRYNDQITAEVPYMRNLELMKLDEYESRLVKILDDRLQWQKDFYDKEVGGKIPVDVDGTEIVLKTTDRLLKVMERRAAYLGLDEQKKEEVNPNELPPAQIAINVQMVMPLLQSVIAGEVTQGTLIEA